MILVASISILSRDPDLSRKPLETEGKQLLFEKKVAWKERGIKP